MTDRALTRFADLARIGTDPQGGLSRFALTPAEREANALVAAWFAAAGLNVRYDAVGNLFGRWVGTEPDAPVVLSGSHLDTVPSGGKYDGTLGVLSPLAAIEVLQAKGWRPRHSIEVVAWMGEESSRFPGTVGSRIALGVVSTEEAAAFRGVDGVVLADALAASGFDPARIGEARLPPGYMKAYVEVHIEQGRVLEEQDLSVGIVTGIAGAIRAKATVTGLANHSGATPMGGLRRDALCAAAEAVLAIERIATHEAGPTTVATVGRIHAFPGGSNVISGRVEFTIDVRDIDEAARDECYTDILAEGEAICRRRQVEWSVTPIRRGRPTPCSADMQELLARACRRAGLPVHRLPSGAGHDAVHLARQGPIGMLFVRSVGGISHNPDEDSRPEDFAAGIRVLAEAFRELAA